MLENINQFTSIFLEKIRSKKLHVISHFDTDGITSAAIMTKTLERLEKHFSTKIIKSLTIDEINNFPENKLIIILDLGSGSIPLLSDSNKEIIIIDHHEISSSYIPSNISILNPHFIDNSDELCTAELTYLVSRIISDENKSLSHLAILGMVGDTMENNINKTRNQILKDSHVITKKGLLIYPSTRPLDKALEFSSRPFIPGVSGNSEGIYDLLSEAGINKIGKNYKALIDLNEREMKNLSTAIALRLTSKESSDYIGNLYLIKLFNKIEDAREISAIINACSRMDEPKIALLFCLGNSSARKRAERIYIKYKQQIISGLRYIEKNQKLEGREYVIINTKDNVKDTIIGTLASILSFSSTYQEGTVIVAMAYNNDKIKVSTRMAGRNPKSPRNLKQLMDSITNTLGHGDSGGHKHAAGCTIHIDKEQEFIELIKKKLEFEMVKV
jgi:single-stranded-DNA-specific exonuclease